MGRPLCALLPVGPSLGGGLTRGARCWRRLNLVHTKKRPLNKYYDRPGLDGTRVGLGKHPSHLQTYAKT